MLLNKYTFEDLRLIASFQLAMQEISGFLKSFDAEIVDIQMQHKSKQSNEKGVKFLKELQC